MPNVEEFAEAAATIGLFTGNLFPDRNIPEPRIKDKRPGRKDRAALFSWKHFQRLIDAVRGSEHESIDNEMLGACKVNVSPVLVKAVIDGIKRKFAIKEDSTWQSVPGDARLDAIQEMEAKASPYIPLRACVGFWGANMLLDYYWSSVRRRNKKQITRGTGKYDDVVEVVQGPSNESRLVISGAMSSSVVGEEFTFEFDASTEFTADGPQRHLLRKRLGDKDKSNSSRNQRRTVTAEEKDEDYGGQ
ncbi:hypothetical protein BCV72DRAFT_323503, partial [Rhizopus microsporus var. microsporus]